MAPICKLGKILGALDKDEREALVTVLDQSAISNQTIVQVLVKHNYEVSLRVVQRHRNRKRAGMDGCSCL